VDEAKEGVVVQVLDKAYPPEIRSSPHRSVLVVQMTILALVCAVGLAFLREAIEKALGNDLFAARLHLLKTYLVSPN
jgi:uncharacterized protein involved in exopolysaccharide biosynthesis